MKRRSVFARRCSIELLEDRRLMAGDVFARIDRGNLIIRGDDAANAITVTAGPVAGQVVVTGLDDGNGVATRVNGASNGAATLSGFNGRIELEMKNGDDRVTLTGLTSRGVVADLGRGNNEMRFTQSSIGRDAKFSSGSGNDRFQFFDVTIGGKLTIDAGDGQDVIGMTGSVEDFAAIKGGGGDDYFEIVANFRRNLLMDGGGGNNTLNLFGGNAQRDVEIRAGSGNDDIRVEDGVILGKLKIEAGDGANLVRVLAHRYSELVVKAGRGMDTVRIDNEFLGGGPTVMIRSVRVDAGDGTNSVDIANFTVTGETEIEGGDDNDTFNSTRSQFGSLEVELCGGANSINFASSTVQRDAEFETGDGNDTCQIISSTVSGDTEVDLGNGNNSLTMRYVEFHGDVTIQGGKGSDSSFVNQLHVYRSLKWDFGDGANNIFIINGTVDGKAEFEGGDGVDLFELVFSNFARLNVEMGKSNDQLRLTEVSTTQLARFDGGKGNDSFLVGLGFTNSFAALDRKSFEIIGTYPIT